MNPPATRRVEQVLRDGDAIDRAILATHRRVILRHQQMRVPLVIWKDGKVIEIPPESIDVPQDDGVTVPPDDRT